MEKRIKRMVTREIKSVDQSRTIYLQYAQQHVETNSPTILLLYYSPAIHFASSVIFRWLYAAIYLAAISNDARKSNRASKKLVEKFFPRFEKGSCRCNFSRIFYHFRSKRCRDLLLTEYFSRVEIIKMIISKTFKCIRKSSGRDIILQ